jgi:hypothetical protein
VACGSRYRPEPSETQGDSWTRGKSALTADNQSLSRATSLKSVGSRHGDARRHLLRCGAPRASSNETSARAGQVEAASVAIVHARAVHGRARPVGSGGQQVASGRRRGCGIGERSGEATRRTEIHAWGPCSSGSLTDRPVRCTRAGERRRASWQIRYGRLQGIRRSVAETGSAIQRSDGRRALAQESRQPGGTNLCRGSRRARPRAARPAPGAKSSGEHGSSSTDRSRH